MIKQTFLNKTCCTVSNNYERIETLFHKNTLWFCLPYVTKPELMANHSKPFPLASSSKN